MLDATEAAECAAATTSDTDSVAESIDNPPALPPKPEATLAPSLPQFQIPEIVVQCCEPVADRTRRDSPRSSSCSVASTASTTGASSLFTSASTSSSRSSLVLSPTKSYPAEFYFPSFPRASVSSLDLLSVPPPSSGPCGGASSSAASSEQVVAINATASNMSEEGVVLALPPPPRASAGRASTPAPACPPSPEPSLTVTSAAAKEERKPRGHYGSRSDVGGVAQSRREAAGEAGGANVYHDTVTSGNESSVGVAGKTKAVSVSASERTGSMDDSGIPRLNRRESKKSMSEDKRRTWAKRLKSKSDSGAPVLPVRLPVSSSTTSSLIDLILEAIAADTDESYHYTSADSSELISSSSASSSLREIEINPHRKTGPYGSFLLLEDGDEENEEDLLDAILSAYIRADDKRDSDDDISTLGCSSSASSDYGDFDEVDLHDSPDCDHEDAKVMGVRFRGTFGEAIRHRVLRGFAI